MAPAPRDLGAGADAPPLGQVADDVFLGDPACRTGTVTLPRSTLFSRAILRTSGEERTRSPGSLSTVSLSASAAAGVSAGWELVGVAAEGAGAAASPGPPASISATTVLIWTVVPACTLISASTPAAGAGISASTLSVEISNSGSSCCTASPGFLSHLVMVPSKIDSPICGMMTSVKAGAAVPAGATGAALAAGAGELAEDAAAGAVSLGVVSLGAGLAAGGCAPFAPASAMIPTTVLIWTVLPSAILISESTPAAGEGISASTLSVEISNSGSSCCTASPGFFSHLVMVPSKIDSPIWGMITSVGMNSLSQIPQGRVPHANLLF